jgi:hypothetical protein
MKHRHLEVFAWSLSFLSQHIDLCSIKSEQHHDDTGPADLYKTHLQKYC